ncbi:hypothetical protein CDCA_CDCA04G1242 [Cyanidium caldarium]|uniref:Uncharacterized protein n=1 Tax=Cyanidium caldarium TaxID=2771 RepID=A0AAV9ISC8_CYACA|nr:hypothetical protein CDCA_CDCA04G1242 [Cyanidium caldarium]
MTKSRLSLLWAVVGWLVLVSVLVGAVLPAKAATEENVAEMPSVERYPQCTPHIHYYDCQTYRHCVRYDYVNYCYETYNDCTCPSGHVLGHEGSSSYCYSSSETSAHTAPTCHRKCRYRREHRCVRYERYKHCRICEYLYCPYQYCGSGSDNSHMRLAEAVDGNAVERMPSCSYRCRPCGHRCYDKNIDFSYYTPSYSSMPTSRPTSSSSSMSAVSFNIVANH